MIPIFVPSRKRFTKSEIVRGSLSQISPTALPNTIVFTNLAEAEQYRDGINRSGYSDKGVRVVPVDSHNLPEKRALMLEFAKKHDIPHFLMMDDDVRFFQRESHESVKLKATTPGQFENMLNTVETWLNDGCGMVGISAREGNNRVGIGDQWDLVMRNTRIMRVWAVRTDAYSRIQQPRMLDMEDFDCALQMLRMGIPNANLFYWANDQGMTNAPGGCSLYRTHELHHAEALKLQSHHADFVKLRQKVNKTGGAFGTRTEVTISWKSAFASSQKN